MAKQDGFAASRLPDDAEYLALFDVKVDIVEYDLRPEMLFEMFYFKQRHELL